MSRLHRRPSSPSAASPLDDDDLLSEILLRLPPQPSSLPRASVVCKRWRLLVSDPGFVHRFCIHHRRNPPLLGCFVEKYASVSFVPTMEAPNRFLPGRFSLHRPADESSFISLGCRHFLVLVLLLKGHRVLVWDPVTGDQHRIAVPPGFAIHAKGFLINGLVLRAAGDVQHLQVVLVVADNKDMQNKQIFARVYSSKTGLWGNLVSTQIPYEPNGFSLLLAKDDAVLTGDFLYWKLGGNVVGILEFDLEKQSLAVIRVPVHMYGKGNCLKIMQAEGGGLGFLFVSKSHYTAQLWKRKTDCDGVPSWGLARTIELDTLLFMEPEEKGRPLVMLRRKGGP